MEMRESSDSEQDFLILPLTEDVRVICLVSSQQQI